MIAATITEAQADTPMRSARDDRHAARAWARDNAAHYLRIRSCGRGAVRDGGVSLVLTGTPGEGASAGFSGVNTCASVWCCAVCAANVQAGRAAELSPALAAWLNAGHGLSLLTLTAEHHAGQALADVWDVVSYGWAAVSQGAHYKGVTKKNGTRVAGTAELFGVEGWMRATEVTVGGNGWHPHVHVLLFHDRPLTAAEAETMERRLFLRWRGALRRKGFGASAKGLDAETGERKGLGVNVRVWGTTDADAAAAAMYPHKGTYAAATWKGGRAAGAEALLSAYKRGRRGNRSPFGVLADLVAATDSGLTGSAEYASDLALWREWEATAPGRRQTGWSRGIREALGLLAEAPSDEELATDDTLGGSVVCTFLAPAWRDFSARWERPANLLTIAETDGPDAARAFAAAWLDYDRDTFRRSSDAAAPCTCNFREAGRRAHLDGCGRRMWREAERLSRLPIPRPRETPVALDTREVDTETGEVLAWADAAPTYFGPYQTGPAPCGLRFWTDKPDEELAYDVPDYVAPVTVGATWDGRDRGVLARSLGLAA